MARPWMGVGLMMLAGCTSLPDFATPSRSMAADISPRAEPFARLQMGDAPPVTLQRPNIPPPEQPIALPTVPQPGSGPIQTSYANRGTVRISVRAWVNGRPIFEDELRQAAGRGQSEAQRAGKVIEHFNKVLDELIDQELMYQDAVKKLEKVNSKALDKLRDYVNKEFDKSLQRMRDAKVPEDQIREMEGTAKRIMERSIISTEYARSRIMPTVSSLVGMVQIREYYETHLEEFKAVDKVVWQNVFIAVKPELPSVDAARRFAEDLINKCRKGDDFNGLMVYNDGDSKLRGGEGLGQRKGEIRPIELEEALFKLKEGAIGPVIPFTTGVHLIRVTKREYAGQLPLNDENQKIIRRTLEGQLMEREYRRITQELRRRAVVRVEHETP